VTDITVSVIITSFERPDSLKLCLLGLARQVQSSFEIIVVADESGLVVLTQLGLGTSVKSLLFEEKNISKARNAGIAIAAGDVIAFIDDDAVPEPTWLNYLTQPFEDPQVGAAGGFVRARNGISFQWKARVVDRLGQHTSLPVPETAVSKWSAQPDCAVRTEGTNMAVRRTLLAQIGGFDPNFRFFLDDTDLNMQLAQRGVVTAISPLAQVHHGYAAGPYRRQDRVPKSLFQIGRSFAVFLKKHAPQSEWDKGWQAFKADQRQRLLRAMVEGRVEPSAVGQLMSDLVAGYQAAPEHLEESPALPKSVGRNFLKFEPATSASVMLAGRSWNRHTILRAAHQHAADRKTVSVFLFSPTTLFHKVRFVDPGIWVQTGGLFGRSERTQPLIRLQSFQSRLQSERERVSKQRNLND
jgi:GT2 family glycosyltransferase